MEDLVLVGSGGFAREVRWLIDECNKEEKKWNILGWISNDVQGTLIAGLPVLGDDEWLMNYSDRINVVLSVGDGLLRKKLSQLYSRNENVNFPNIIAPSALIGESTTLGRGCIITAQSILTVDIEIGDFFVSNLGATVGHDCKVGDYVTLFPGAHISGNVLLGQCVSIGTGASVIQGITIGNSSFIGAGAAVVRNIPDNCTAVGVPAKPINL